MSPIRAPRRITAMLATLVLATLAACGGGGGSSGDGTGSGGGGPPPPPSAPAVPTTPAADRQDRRVPVPEPGDLRSDGGRGAAPDRARRFDHRLFALDRRADRATRLGAAADHPDRLRRPHQPRADDRIAQRRPPGDLVPQLDHRPRPAAPARRVRALRDHGGLAAEHAAEHALCARRLLRPPRARRVRRLPQAHRRRDAAPRDGRVPQHARQPEARHREEHPPGRELRARADAAAHHRPRRAQHRRHREDGRAGPAHPDLRPVGDRRLRQRLHGLELLRRRELRAGPTHAREPGAADAGLSRAALAAREEAAAVPGRREADPCRGPGAAAGPRRRARQHLQPSERRPVHLEAADPEAGDQQSVAAVRRARDGRVQQRRQRQARQPRRGREGDPARRGGSPRDAEPRRPAR